MDSSAQYGLDDDSGWPGAPEEAEEQDEAVWDALAIGDNPEAHFAYMKHYNERQEQQPTPLDEYLKLRNEHIHWCKFPDMMHACTAKCSLWHQPGKAVVVCRMSLRTHICDDDCTYMQTTTEGDFCILTGRVSNFQQMTHFGVKQSAVAAPPKAPKKAAARPVRFATKPLIAVMVDRTIQVLSQVQTWEKINLPRMTANYDRVLRRCHQRCHDLAGCLQVLRQFYSLQSHYPVATNVVSSKLNSMLCHFVTRFLADLYTRRNGVTRTMIVTAIIHTLMFLSTGYTVAGRVLFPHIPYAAQLLPKDKILFNGAMLDVVAGGKPITLRCCKLTRMERIMLKWMEETGLVFPTVPRDCSALVL